MNGQLGAVEDDDDSLAEHKWAVDGAGRRDAVAVAALARALPRPNPGRTGRCASSSRSGPAAASISARGCSPTNCRRYGASRSWSKTARAATAWSPSPRSSARMTIMCLLVSPVQLVHRAPLFPRQAALRPEGPGADRAHLQDRGRGQRADLAQRQFAERTGGAGARQARSVELDHRHRLHRFRVRRLPAHASA